MSPERLAELREIGRLVTARYGSEPTSRPTSQPSAAPHVRRGWRRMQREAARAGIKLKLP